MSVAKEIWGERFFLPVPLSLFQAAAAIQEQHVFTLSYAFLHVRLPCFYESNQCYGDTKGIEPFV